MDNYKVRRFKDRLFSVLGLVCVVAALLPLGSILLEVIVRGAPEISWAFLTQTPGAEGGSVGGIGPAIQGTLILIGLTGLFGIPIGIMSGVFLAEYGDNKYASLMRLFNDVLTEFPSIVAGVTVFLTVVIYFGHFSPIAGSLALSFILIPIVARTTEESIKLVPNSLREASSALGVRRWRTTMSVVIQAARAGLITGSLLAVARIAGESAPLIMTTLGNSYYFEGFNQPMDALPLRIWRDALQPYPDIQAAGWGAAFVLIAIVLIINIGVRLATRRRSGF
jgi:phosphate transport system permease protein